MVTLSIRAKTAVGIFSPVIDPGPSGPTFFAAMPTDGGSASNSGGELAPWTPQHALSVAQPGDTIRFKGAEGFAHATGTWEGGAMNPANNGTSTAPITLISHVPRLFVVNFTTYTDGGGIQHRPAIGLLNRNYIHAKDFTVNGVVKARGANNNNGNNPNMMRGIVFEGLDIIGGDHEGNDGSLNWGLAFQWIRDSVVRHCSVRGMTPATDATFNNNSTGDNTACYDCFDSTDNIFENNFADCSDVHSGFGQKAGNCHRNIFRYNIACNARDGNGGGDGAGFYNKADTSATKFCDDDQFYQNIVWNCYRAFQLNHNCRRTIIKNNASRNCDWFFRQWQTNNIDSQIFNNISRGDGSTRFMEFEAGAANTLPNYLEEANYNCNYNAGTDHCFIGGTSISLANFPSNANTAGITGREANSISGNPLYVSDVDDGDFHLQGGSPCRNSGKDGVHMGPYLTGSEIIGPSWRP